MTLLLWMLLILLVYIVSFPACVFFGLYPFSETDESLSSEMDRCLKSARDYFEKNPLMFSLSALVLPLLASFLLLGFIFKFTGSILSKLSKVIFLKPISLFGFCFITVLSLLYGSRGSK